MYTTEAFETELSWIKNETIREFTRYCLNNAPPYFFENASSSTGKYHSAWSNGSGGLVRHSKATAYIANALADAYSLDSDEKDAATSAAILHDLTKYGFPGGRYTTKDHDYVAANYVHKLAAKFCASKGVEAVPLLKDICGGIAYHFGRWTDPVSARPLKRFPEEYSKVEQLVHVADMVASRKEVRFAFLEENFIG